jgi:hypothetical protein
MVLFSENTMSSSTRLYRISFLPLCLSKIWIRGIAPLLAVAIVLVCGNALAQIVTTPPGLNPGDPYRLAFVTNAQTLATSGNISFYNDYVTDVANTGPGLLAPLGLDWIAIASTANIDARDNTGTNPNTSAGVPIYNLDGLFVAANNADLWDGTLVNPINVSELGTEPPLTLNDRQTWTGTRGDGTGDPGFLLSGGSGQAASGRWSITANDWWVRVTTNQQNSREFSVYGISGQLTAVPEPSATMLLLTGGIFLFGGRRRR